MRSYEPVLDFWFSQKEKEGTLGGRRNFWFKKNPKVDREIKERFEDYFVAAMKGHLDEWAITYRGRLALIIVLDQFPRNMYRDTPAAFSGDTKALELSVEGIEKGFDQKLSQDERAFFYMPLMHSENKDLQEKSVMLFKNLEGDEKTFHKYALMHKELIDKFGRFPHRNKTLGRKSTSEELEYLSNHSGF